MALSNDLVSQFVKATLRPGDEKKETTVYGVVVEKGDKLYVKLDGSDLMTPAASTINAKPGDRVTVLLKNHSATVTGNISSPSASGDTVNGIQGDLDGLKKIVADKADIGELEAGIARIEKLEAKDVIISGELDAANATIESLKAHDVEITGKLEATEAEIENLEVTKLSADIADLRYATIENLNTTNANIHNLEADFGDFKQLSADRFDATDASIKNLEVEKLSAKDAEIKYANIDFTNIGKAAIENLFSDSGLIKDLVVGDGTITGELVGVTIRGDLIEGNTIVADKLVIKGSDGLYYKLNTDGMTTESEQTDYNSLNGQVIRAKSVTATKIAVDDLVAFDATIGGMQLTEGSIYSGVKETVDNTTRGFYLDKTGQMAVGDSQNYLKYFKDSDGTYKLEISANSIKISAGGSSGGGGSDTTLQEEIDNLKDHMNQIEDEVTTLLRIESSRGTVFKNDQVSTVLSAVIYRGGKRITDIQTLKEVIGPGAYLEWSWQRLNDESFGVISADDKRIGAGGFTFTLSPEDVDTKVTFLCQLIV